MNKSTLLLLAKIVALSIFLSGVIAADVLMTYYLSTHGLLGY